MKTGRRLRCSSVTYRFRYAHSTASLARTTVELRLPALRERLEDIPLLAHHFLTKHATRYRKLIQGLDQEAEKALLLHLWPGNVRELDHAMERAVLMATTDLIQVVDVGLRSPAGDSGVRLEDLSLEEVELHLIKKA